MKKEVSAIKLSIVIPYYKTLLYTEQLFDVLIPQLTKEVEVCVIDDGCNELELDKYKEVKVLHIDNGGVSNARNVGINNTTGQYIAFIDSDDMVVEDYVKKILSIKEDYDYCYLSWKDTKGNEYIIENEPPEFNKCVWNCVYSRKLIGNKRFRKNLQYGEDWDFNDRVRKGNKKNITDIMYIYNAGREDSLTDKYCKGEITKDRPLKAQVVMFLRFVSKIGGVETFLYEFFKEFHNKYDILFLYDECDPVQLNRYSKLVKCERYYYQNVECETYLNVNFNKNIADNVIASSGNYYDMCHTDYDAMGWKYTKHPKTTMTIGVSEASRKSFLKQFPQEQCITIHNLLKHDLKKIPNTDKKLHLISTTRLSYEKGYSRMKALANRMNELSIPFIWEVYTNDMPNEEIPNLIFKQPRLDIMEETCKADILAQLSDTEADGYATKEAFSLGIPVLATNYPSIYEQGMKVGKNGWVIEMDLSNMDEVIKSLKRLDFKPQDFNFAGLWENLLGEHKKSNYVWDGTMVDESPDRWIALDRVRDDTNNIVYEGEEAMLYSGERIRILLENKLIKRMEEN